MQLHHAVSHLSVESTQSVEAQTQVNMPWLCDKCSNGRHHAIHYQTPAQEYQIEPAGSVVLDWFFRNNWLLDQLRCRRRFNGARVCVERCCLGRALFAVLVALLWCQVLASGKVLSAGGNDAGKDEDEEQASDGGEFGHEPSVVGLVKFENRRRIQLHQQGDIIGSKLRVVSDKNIGDAPRDLPRR